MKLSQALRRLRIDPYILAILAMVGVATVLPVRGEVAEGFGWATKIVIAILFFLHGARLSREAVIAGISHWRLHLIVLGATFALFPLLGLATTLIPTAILPASLASGVVFLCCLPSTVQSSIAFTSIARGNVAAAVCAASLSNLVGVVVTPVLVALLLRAHSGGFSVGAAEAIVLQLLLPFGVGQVSRIWIAEWAARNKAVLSLFDRGSILLVVYTAFSEAVVHGIWGQVTVFQLMLLALLCAALLAVVLGITAFGSRALGFDKADEITIMFCGSKKSLASGVPMAGILFPAATVGLLVLPLMLFHQIQLMVCAYLATRYSGRPAETLSEAVMAD